MKMDYAFEVLRGYPTGGALDNSDYKTDDLTVKAGDVVVMNTSNLIEKQASTASASSNVGIVFRGPGDQPSNTGAYNSANFSNNVVVLWGNFIAKTQVFDTTATLAPGDSLTASGGVLTAASAGTPGTSFPDPVVAQVLQVNAATGSEPANLTFVFK